MRRQSFLTITLLFFQFVSAFAAPAAIQEFQEPQNLDTTATPHTKQQQPVTATLVTKSGAKDAFTKTTTDTAATTTTHDAVSNTRSSSIATPTTTVPSLNTPTTVVSQPYQQNSNQTYSGGLPIHPQISPAVGLGGIILLLLGGTLAFVGVLKKWYVLDYCRLA